MAPSIHAAPAIDALSNTYPNQAGYFPTGLVARAIGVSSDTIQRMLARYGPVEQALRSYKRDLFLGGWQYSYLSALQQLEEVDSLARESVDDHRKVAAIRRDLSVSMGIATEKAQLVAGQPTQIVAGIHEVRHTLPEVASRLAALAKRVHVDGKRISDDGLADGAMALPMPEQARDAGALTDGGGLGSPPPSMGTATVPTPTPPHAKRGSISSTQRRKGRSSVANPAT